MSRLLLFIPIINNGCIRWSVMSLYNKIWWHLHNHVLYPIPCVMKGEMVLIIYQVYSSYEKLESPMVLVVCRPADNEWCYAGAENCGQFSVLPTSVSSYWLPHWKNGCSGGSSGFFPRSLPELCCRLFILGALRCGIGLTWVDFPTNGAIPTGDIDR